MMNEIVTEVYPYSKGKKLMNIKSAFESKTKMFILVSIEYNIPFI